MAAKKKLKTFVINREKWLRGEDDSYLLRERDGLMCCLGQIACQLGAKPRHITGIARPDEVDSDLNLEWNTSLASIEKMMNVNDDLDIDDVKRERRLIRTAQRIGWRLRFTGAPNKQRPTTR